MSSLVTIDGRPVGPGHPTYVVAEMSGNHLRSLDRALELVRLAKQSGADAIKLQTYTPDTLTLDCDRPEFRIGAGTQWEGLTLHELYQRAFTPWEWHPRLMEEARRHDLTCFSTPFDPTAVDFLEDLEVPAYKIASFELVDHGLVSRVAATGKPLILSTGMATLGEIDEAVRVARRAGCKDLVLLKCTSSYPARPEEMDLATIPHLADTFSVPVGLSDHTLGIEVPIAAVTLGACLVEKHFIRSRSEDGPDSSFSLEPDEWRRMVDAIRTVEKALGSINYELSEHEKASTVFRRSLFVVRTIEEGEVFTDENVRSIRPGDGLPPRELPRILGRRAARRLEAGTPLDWSLVAGGSGGV